MITAFFYISMLLIMVFIFSILPYITRRTEQFGVTIPYNIYMRTDIKQIRKTYVFYTILLGIIIVLLQLCLHIFFRENVQHIGFTINTFLFIILSFFVYLQFHKKMKNMKAKENWSVEKTKRTVIDTSFHHERNVLSNWFYLIPLVVTIGTILYTFFMYDSIPNEIPMHTNVNGEVRYDAKTPFNVLVMPGTQLFMIGLFFFINIIIGKAKQQIHAGNPKVSKIQNQLYRKKWSRFLFISSILMVLMFLFIQLTFIHPILQKYETPITLVIIAIIFIGSIILSIRTGQGGSRIKMDDDQIDDRMIDRDEDEHWKLGQFYFNKNDPSIFIEKRFGVGWTNNWAHPISWILLLLIIGTAIGIPLLLTNL